jgi:hypothetical protein
MKTKLLSLALALPAAGIAGDFLETPVILEKEVTSDDPFARAIRPITSPTLFDLAVPRTSANLIYINQSMPGSITAADGSSVMLGGDFNVYALQLEYALNERTSIIATKDGYIDFNPDNTLNPNEGFANLGAGIKRALIYNPEDQFILSGIVGVEVPTGNSDVWQGKGDGALDLRLTTVKLWDRIQLATSASLHIPFDNSESTTGMVNIHASYEVTPWFIPLIELSWFRTLDEGDGSFGFKDQLGNAVPQIASFEGGDLINWGTANGEENADIINLAVGFRSRLSDHATFGIAYEFPLTNDNETLLDERITASLTYTF